MKAAVLPLDKTERWTNDYFASPYPNCYTMAVLHYFCEAQMHTHDFYEINFVMHGNGKYYYEDMCMDATVGDIFVTPPNSYHGYLKKTDFYIYNLCIHKDFFNYYKKEISALPMVEELLDGLPVLHKVKSDAFSLHVTTQELVHLKSDLDLVFEVNLAENASREDTKNIITLKILAQLGFLYSLQFAKWKHSKENSSFALIMESLHFMKTNFAEKITIENLADVAHMSRSSYIRQFKKIFGTSPMDYLRGVRIERARKMIASGNYTKSFIAQECGFYDAAHMGKYI